MVLDIFKSVKGFVKRKPVLIDNSIFRLHYRATILFLLSAALLVTSSQFFGEPIHCIQLDDVPLYLLETYCWIHSTFTLPSANNKIVGEEVAHPGIEQYIPGEKRVYHKYYQWVCFVLFLQAVMFYVPHYFWKLMEGGRVKSLVNTLNLQILKKQDKDDQIDLVVNYLKSNIRYHNSYFFYFVFCEICNFINVILQMYLINSFLGGAFWTYGSDVLKYSETDQENRVDPMIAVFPRMTKCTFHRYGSSGDVQRHDALCILPLNIINEKIYVFLWFWLIILAILSGLILVWRMLTIFIPKIRYFTLKMAARLTDPYDLRIVMDVSKIGDWFLLYSLCKNIDGHHFKELMAKYSKQICEDGTDGNLLDEDKE